jgi:FkbM family methyltransferase
MVGEHSIARSRALWSLIILTVSLVSFTAGFQTHRARWHEPMQALIAFAKGDTGGCDLRQAYSAVRSDGFDSAVRALQHSATLLDTEDGLERWQTNQGTFWTPPGTALIYVLAEQAVRVYGDGDNRVRSGDTVLDCGANIGAFTREALNAGANLVVAIEPVPANVESLRRTFRGEIEAGRVRIVPKGVWNKDDVLEMTLFENSVLDSFVMTDRPGNQKQKKVALPLTTIDNIVKEIGLDRVDFVKMDIEGAERHALEGARQTIRRFKPRMAIATENLTDDYQVVPKVVSDIHSGYGWSCGPSRMKGPFTTRPEVLYFRLQRP